jgi:hypothetical protein
MTTTVVFAVSIGKKSSKNRVTQAPLPFVTYNDAIPHGDPGCLDFGSVDDLHEAHKVPAQRDAARGVDVRRGVEGAKCTTRWEFVEAQSPLSIEVVAGEHPPREVVPYDGVVDGDCAVGYPRRPRSFMGTRSSLLNQRPMSDLKEMSSALW